MKRFALAAVSVLTALIVIQSPAVSPAQTLQKVFVAAPRTNLPNIGEWAANDSRLVYVLSNPSMGPPNDPNRGYYFRDFHPEVYAVSLSMKNGRLTRSEPHLLFTGPKGKTLAVGSALGGWLVYEELDSNNLGSLWRIIARNISTGKEWLIDSRDLEGVPSLTNPPSSDGHTVAWQSWTILHGQVTSVVRTFNLQTGQRRLLLSGGSPKTWAYTGVNISGNRVVFEKDVFAKQYAQIMLADLTTGLVRPLTATNQRNSEPDISGDIATWKVGWRFTNGRGIVVADVRTGVRTTIPGFNAEAPKVTASRYVVFSSGGNTVVKLYDRLKGSVETLAPQNDGYGVGNVVRAAGHTVVYEQGKPCGDPNFQCPTRIVVTRLP